MGTQGTKEVVSTSVAALNQLTTIPDVYVNCIEFISINDY